MSQQINLYDPQRRRTRSAMTSSHLGWVLCGCAALGAAVGLTLNGLAVRERGLLRESQTELNALRHGGALPTQQRAQRQAELERLRRLEAGRLRVQQLLALNRRPPPQAEAGHGAPYFDALSRRARGDLWITAFSVSADGRQLELSGRMLAAPALPSYLRSLNDEALFRGRPFAQLDIRTSGRGEDAAEPGAGTVTDFTLRSQPARDEVRP